MNKISKGHAEVTGNGPELAFLRHQQEALSSLAEVFLRGEDSSRLYDIVSEKVREVLKADGCLLVERASVNEDFNLFSACGLCEKSALEATEWLENDQFTTTMETGETIVVSDYEASDRFHPPDRKCFKNYRSGMSIPIPGQEDAPRGFLAVYYSRSRIFSDDELDFLKTISNLLAGALSRDSKERALKESEARFKAILNTAVDGIITIDAYGIISMYNQAAEKMFGYRNEEVMGRNIKMLMPQPYRDEHDQYLENYHATGKKKIIGIGREVTGQRKDGSTFPLYLAVSKFYVGERLQFTGIIRDISEQRMLEQEVLRISEHERRRIGQDLHDGLGQMLTGIGLLSQGLQKKLNKEESTYAEAAAEITRLIREADQYAKNLSRGLLPVDLDSRGLVTSLERLVANAERLFGVKCTFSESKAPVFSDNAVVEHLFRIAQEGISNSVKHGMANEIRLELTANKEFASLRVIDDGKGFSEHWEKEKGSGIDIMRFRAQLISANLDVENLDGGGAMLSCIIPRAGVMYRIGNDDE